MHVGGKCAVSVEQRGGCVGGSVVVVWFWCWPLARQKVRDAISAGETRVEVA
jgi:hypothetical protein